jgi:thiamine-phosphate pyrophosphorylase
MHAGALGGPFQRTLLNGSPTLVEMIRYAIADRDNATTEAGRWAKDGIDYIQLREKKMNAGELTVLARRVLEEVAAVPGAKTRLLLNGRADVAIAAGAAGVHLTSHPDELTPVQVRSVFTVSTGREPVISVSCHTLDEVQRAHDARVDLILFGPVFEKRIARQLIRDGSGLEALTDACRAAAGTPVLALGGITLENTPACLDAGAAGIAAIRLFA